MSIVTPHSAKRPWHAGRTQGGPDDDPICAGCGQRDRRKPAAFHLAARDRGRGDLRYACCASTVWVDTRTCFRRYPRQFFTPPEVLPDGDYTWSYAVWSDGSPRKASGARKGLSLLLPVFRKRLLPVARIVCRVPILAHPRLWLGPEGLKAFRKALAKDANHCNWQTFHEKSVKPWAGKPSMKEPAGYPDDIRVAPIWRQTYIDCQELIYAIRHLAVAGHVLENDDYLATAKDWLLEAASWDP